MEFLPGEREDLDLVINLARQWGYGRLIQVIQQAWSEQQQADGFRRETADRAAGIVCVWCGTDRRTGQPQQAKGDEAP